MWPNASGAGAPELVSADFARDAGATHPAETELEGGEFAAVGGWHALLYWNYALLGGLAVSAAYGVLFVGAVAGNVAILVLYALGRKPSAFPRVNVLVLHMAATDLLVALAVIPVNLCSELLFGARRLDSHNTLF